MARLFITSRELDLISDLTKEVTKDVIGQRVFYYRVREDLSNTHDVYEESTEKVFDPPIDIDARVEWSSPEAKTNNYGNEVFYTLVVYFHYRDMLDKGIDLRTGDVVSHGTVFYEITSVIPISTIFGQIEHLTGYKATCKQARDGIISKRPNGPLEEKITDPDAVQDTFSQQRGQVSNDNGETNDVRELQKKGVLDAPITGAKNIKKDGISSSFYGDDE
jgi:hypothetical protein